MARIKVIEPGTGTPVEVEADSLHAQLWKPVQAGKPAAKPQAK